MINEIEKSENKDSTERKHKIQKEIIVNDDFGCIKQTENAVLSSELSKKDIGSNEFKDIDAITRDPDHNDGLTEISSKSLSSDLEDEQNSFTLMNSKKKKKHVIMDSDSENDENSKNSIADNKEHNVKDNSKCNELSLNSIDKNIDKCLADSSNSKLGDISLSKEINNDIKDNAIQHDSLSDSENEDSGFSLTKSKSKIKGKHVINSDDDSDNENFDETNIAEKEDLSLLNDDDEANGENSKTIKKKHFFQSDSESNNDSGIENNSDSVVLKSRSADRKKNLKKDRGKALEELVSRKKYGTRKAENDEVIEENNNLNKDLFKNEDLFSADNSSGSEQEKEPDTFNTDEGRKKKKKKIKKEKNDSVKKPTKSMIHEQKSEQQRLLREQKVEIPYHQPKLPSLKDFLQRVPKSTSLKRVDDDIDFKKNPPSKLQNLFQQKPRLSTDLIEFEEDPKENVPSEKQQKEMRKLDLFLKRFAKHSGLKKEEKKEENAKDVVVTAVKSSPMAGLPHEILKRQLKQQIMADRRKSYQEMEKQMKLYNEEELSEEELEQEEEEEEEEEIDNEGSLVSNEEGGLDIPEEDGTCVTDDKSDEEIEKWNTEDELKQLEVSMQEEEEKQETEGEMEKDNEYIDEASCSSSANIATPNLQTNDSNTQWSDSSSLLQPGQGNQQSTISADADVKTTPYTKLLKSGLLDSACKSSFENRISHDGNFGIELPCEDTQDLFKEESAKPPIVDEESQSLPAGFHFTLDEETQFDNILNSQGFLNANKKAKKTQPKKLFDQEMQENSESMTQILGFCSGKFDSDSKETNMKHSNMVSSIVLPKDSKVTELMDDEGDGIAAAIGFCSGNFTDFKTQPDSKEGNAKQNDMVDNFVLTKDSKASGLMDEEIDDGIAAAIGFCSGNFTDFKTQPDTKEANVKQNVIVDDMALPKDSKVSGHMGDEGDGIAAAIGFCSGKLTDFKTQPEKSKLHNHDKDNGVEEFNSFIQKEIKSSNRKNEFMNEDTSTSIEKVTSTKIKEIKENAKSYIDDVGEVENYEEEDTDFEDENEGTENKQFNTDDNQIIDEEVDDLDDDDDEDDVDDDVDDDDKENVPEEAEELKEWEEYVAGDKKMKKLNKRAFYEEEAELSGSDDNSEDEELGSDFDDYEIDSEDEAGLPTGDKLRRQVHKIHQQKMIDQDKKEVRLLQEIYFEDGDLGVGQARKRNFRWRNIDDSNSLQKEEHDSDEDGGEDMVTTNVEARMQRIEKEKFLQDSEKEADAPVLDESSQSILNLIQLKQNAKEDINIAKHSSQKSNTQKKRSGSFLHKHASSLSNSAVLKSNNQKSKKSFVFQLAEDESKDIKDKKSSVQTASSEPSRKKQKLEQKRSVPKASSIFNLL